MKLDPLAVDLYAGDGHFDIAKVLDAGPPWHVFMGKFSQGNYYCNPEWSGWFWKTVQAHPRFGVDAWEIPYHYLDVRIDGVAQADFFLTQIDRAGGWNRGVPYTCVDVERAGQRGPLSAQLVIDRTSAFVERVRGASGLQSILYGGSFLRELHIKDRMGCKYAWVARYAASLPAETYTSIGFDLESLFAWQGVGVNGDGSVDDGWKVNGYPDTTPAGHADISAITIAGGGDAALANLRDACVHAPT